MPNKSVRAAAEGMPNPMSAFEAISQLETGLHNAVNMAELTTGYVDDLHRIRREPDFGNCRMIGEDDMRLLAFSAYHTLALVEALKAEWNDLHARVAAEKGGAL